MSNQLKHEYLTTMLGINVIVVYEYGEQLGELQIWALKTTFVDNVYEVKGQGFIQFRLADVIGIAANRIVLK